MTARRLWHAVRDRHVGTWIEERCGVAHHVCSCGWVTPARKLGPAPTTSKDKYDFEKAARSRRLAEALRVDRQRLALRRGDAGSTPVTIHRFESDRRSTR